MPVGGMGAETGRKTVVWNLVFHDLCLREKEHVRLEAMHI